VPVPLAGGTQYKLLESMAVGLPAVVSDVSAAITGVTDGEQVLVGGTPGAYAEAVCRLLDDPALGARISAGARRFVRSRHTWESKRPLLERLLRPDAPSGPAAPTSGTQ
jgi:glycosyltransferase involved in cell wall biosynthesis